VGNDRGAVIGHAWVEIDGHSLGADDGFLRFELSRGEG
jgi:hypothetical protein